MDESIDEDHLDDFQFPDVTNFGSVQYESVRKPLDTFRFLHEADDYSSEVMMERLKKTSKWQLFRASSPVIDAWLRWTNSSEFNEDELCSFLNASASSRPIQLVSSYMLGDDVQISIEELKDVLEISDMLLLEDLANYCKYRIQNIELNEDNFLQILQVSSLYDFVNPGMKRFVTSHLMLLHETDGSESLTYDTVIFLLTNDLLIYWGMEERFHFITKWCRASMPRCTLFSSLFAHIDMSCLDSDFIESIVREDLLVRSSEVCLRRVNDALKQYRTRKKVAALLIHNPDSGLYAYILENRRSGYLTIPRKIEESPFALWATVLPDSIVFITNKYPSKRRDVVKYDINTGNIKTKNLVGSTLYKDELSDLVWQNDVGFCIGHDIHPVRKEKELSVGFKSKRKARIVVSTKQVPFSTVYMKTKENTYKASFLPLMSFHFEIIQICIFKSRLFLRSRSDESFFHFNWANSKLTKTAIPQDMYSPSALISLLPLNDTVFALFQSYIIQLVLDENTEIMKSTRKFYVDIGSDPFFTLAIEDTLVRVDNEYVHVCDTIQNPTSWKSFESNYCMLTNQSNVCHGFLRRNVRLCHQDCPHCFPVSAHFEDEDIDFAKLYKEKVELEAEKKLKIELAKFKSATQRYDDYYDRYDFFHDYDFYEEYYDDDDDDDYYGMFDDEPRMIFLASDDEWVEEWW